MFPLFPPIADILAVAAAISVLLLESQLLSLSNRFRTRARVLVQVSICTSLFENLY